MKISLQIVVFLLCSLFSMAQSPVTITINHLLEGEPFQNEVAAVNDLGNDFMIDRLQYYLSGFSIVHDGGNIIEIPDLYVLVSLMENTDPLSIDLGEHAIQSLEGIRFHLGIDYDNNHADPASWDPDHPLAPKVPSMHWGWAAGYRFIVLEGQSGPSIDQEMQFHCIGDDFYQPISFDFSLQDQSNYLVELNAEYTQLIKGIDVSNGLIIHGPLGEIIPLADNMIHEVFSLTNLTSSVKNQDWVDLSLYPNPSNQLVQIEYNVQESDVLLKIYNAIGEKIYSTNCNGACQVSLDQAGMYFAVLVNSDGAIIAERRFMIE